MRRTGGRSAGLAWHIEASPLAFTAVARRVKEQSLPVSDSGQDKLTGLKPASSNSYRDKPKQKSTPVVNFIPYRVVLVIEARSGHKYAEDTIKIGPAQTDEQ